MTDPMSPEPIQPESPEVSRIDRSDERGQGLVEYAFILVLVAIVVIVALQVLGGTTSGLYTNISHGVSTATGH